LAGQKCVFAPPQTIFLDPPVHRRYSRTNTSQINHATPRNKNLTAIPSYINHSLTCSKYYNNSQSRQRRLSPDLRYRFASHLTRLRFTGGLIDFLYIGLQFRIRANISISQIHPTRGKHRYLVQRQPPSLGTHSRFQFRSQSSTEPQIHISPSLTTISQQSVLHSEPHHSHNQSRVSLTSHQTSSLSQSTVFTRVGLFAG